MVSKIFSKYWKVSLENKSINMFYSRNYGNRFSFFSRDKKYIRDS